MAATQGLASSIFPLAIFGVTIPGYAALYSVLINFLLAMCLSPIVNLLPRPPQRHIGGKMRPAQPTGEGERRQQ